MRMKLFHSEIFGGIRLVEQDGQCLICALDAARALGYQDTKTAIRNHCRPNGWSYIPVADQKGRFQQTRFLTEGNLCRLIVGSRKPNALLFENWIFEEVIPRLRRQEEPGADPACCGGLMAELYRQYCAALRKEEMQTE